MSEMMNKGIAQLEANGVQAPSLSAVNSAKIIAQAPVTVLVFNSYWKVSDDHNGPGHYWSLSDTQSVGAAIQNMLLTAEELGLGSLWIGDIYVAEHLLPDWLGCQDELVAAVSFGYPAEAPAARPRKPWSEITTWLE